VIATSGGAWIFGENGTTSYPANVIAASFTGSLLGTASYASTALSADDFIVRGNLTVTGSILNSSIGLFNYYNFT
jgi:hypothetical protein